MDFSLYENINQDSHQLLLKGMKQNILAFTFQSTFYALNLCIKNQFYSFTIETLGLKMANEFLYVMESIKCSNKYGIINVKCRFSQYSAHQRTYTLLE
jgi:hypothetical protein